MRHIHDTETMREHRRALIAEAENARLARQLKEVRRNSRKVHSGTMQPRTVLLLSTIGLALLFVVSADLLAGKDGKDRGSASPSSSVSAKTP